MSEVESVTSSSMETVEDENLSLLNENKQLDTGNESNINEILGAQNLQNSKIKADRKSPEGTTSKKKFRVSDVPMNPSYTKLMVPYNMVCKYRLVMHSIDAKIKMNDDRYYYEKMSPFALGGITLHRMFIGGLEVPDVFPDPLTRAERIRLENIIESRKN